MTVHGYEFFMKINIKVNQFLYKQILEVDFCSTICWIQLDPKCLIFQHDNASIHTTKMIKQ